MNIRVLPVYLNLRADNLPKDPMLTPSHQFSRKSQLFLNRLISNFKADFSKRTSRVRAIDWRDFLLRKCCTTKALESLEAIFIDAPFIILISWWWNLSIKLNDDSMFFFFLLITTSITHGFTFSYNTEL